MANPLDKITEAVQRLLGKAQPEDNTPGRSRETIPRKRRNRSTGATAKTETAERRLQRPNKLHELDFLGVRPFQLC